MSRAPLRARLDDHFARQQAIYWANLARTAGLLAILNVTLFFVTGLVTHQGYWFTYISLAALGGIYFLMLVPLGLTERLGTYLACLVLLAISGYFLIASVVHWVRHPAMQMRGLG
ncbi:MAG: hypothetical protein ACRD2Z_10520 [Thermoanaerobaculia bacterium]